MRGVDHEMEIPDARGVPVSKFLVIGDSQCGKSTFLYYYTNEIRREKKTKKTIGCEVHLKEFVKRRNHSQAREYVEFWDLSGDVKFQPFLKVYTEALHSMTSQFKGIIYCFDMSNIKTLHNISSFLSQVVEKQSSQESEEEGLNSSRNIAIPLFIIGLKGDLLDIITRVKREQEIQRYLNQHFGNEPNLKFMLIGKETDVSEMVAIDRFVESCLSGNDREIFIYDRSNDTSQSNFSSKRLTSFMEFLGGVYDNTIGRVRNLFRKDRREELIM
jgi:GTPase SAR1 family protein